LSKLGDFLLTKSGHSARQPPPRLVPRLLKKDIVNCGGLNGGDRPLQFRFPN